MSIPEGPLVEILSRVPYKSLCRFKCVSKPWFALCSDREILKKSPQSLAGFFLNFGGNICVRNLSGRGPPLVDLNLQFLRENYKRVWLEQCCGGLLLCDCAKSRSLGGGGGGGHDYVVCNPATKEWTVLPHIQFLVQGIVNVGPLIYLGFDAAVPSRFVAFALSAPEAPNHGQVSIYSSETGRWTSVQSKWASGTTVNRHAGYVFLNGAMHLTTFSNSIVTVDAEGKVWREIEMPDDLPTLFTHYSIGQSQGLLYAWRIENVDDYQLYIWVLEDYINGKWALKHTMSVLKLFTRHHKGYSYSYTMFAVHPDCNVIFVTNKQKLIMSYNMDNQKVRVFSTSTQSRFGLPYIPCFAEWPSAGQ
ncbi:hypothetical protein CFC21_000435 [Triticum aestivum]|uniref:F-box domain-containing protein n=2 Tax=Triticum aestivum TaxID=4565 RepID=A0A3B5XU56_WHEAT|nr:hypothetical protein CFC21_000435 [Triticum aestivum]